MTDITIAIAIIFCAKWIIGNIADHYKKEKALKEITIRTKLIKVRNPNEYQHRLNFGRR